MTPERLAAIEKAESAAHGGGDDVLALLDEDVSPVAGRRFTRALSRRAARAPRPRSPSANGDRAHPAGSRGGRGLSCRVPGSTPGRRRRPG